MTPDHDDLFAALDLPCRYARGDRVVGVAYPYAGIPGVVHEVFPTGGYTVRYLVPIARGRGTRYLHLQYQPDSADQPEAPPDQGRGDLVTLQRERNRGESERRPSHNT